MLTNEILSDCPFCHPMRMILLGNAGAGKSTFARKLIRKEPAVRLSLDQIAFAQGTNRRPLVGICQF